MNIFSLLTGRSRQLDGRVTPEEVVNETITGNPKLLSELLTRVLRDVAELKRRYYPQRTDFEDIDFGVSTTHRLSHRFGCRVRWWVVDQSGDIAELIKSDETDGNTLVLLSDVACRATVRVEEAG